MSRRVFFDYGLLIALFFLLNFFWESWHAVFLYKGFEGAIGRHADSFQAFVSLIFYVSTVDATILLLITLSGALFWKRFEWFLDMDLKKAVCFACIALLWAAAIEYKAVFIFHQWEYSPLMPTIFGLGVSPLIQLMTTGFIALYAVICTKEQSE